MRTRSGLFRQSVRTLLGVTLGSLLAWIEFAFLVLGLIGLIPVLTLPTTGERVVRFAHRCAWQLARLEERRLRRYHGMEDLGPYPPSSAYSYVARRWPIGMLGGLVLLILLLGVVTAGTMLSSWIAGGSWSFIEEDGGRVTWETIIAALIPGVLLLYLNVMGIVGIGHLDTRLARRYLVPSVEEVLARRVSELTLSRAEVVQVVNDERRRIERDLHDGVQQRLVALGLLLARARRSGDPAHAADLIRQAHEASEQALDDLRDVAWRVYPTVLDQFGLRDVLAVLAERSSIPVTLDYRLTDRPPAPVETVVYFVVAEALTNASKHSNADHIEVQVIHRAGPGAHPSTPATPHPSDSAPPTAADRIIVTVTDNGHGGAALTGRGLTGLAGRIAASDGTLHITSPPGGPTTIRTEIPWPDGPPQPPEP